MNADDELDAKVWRTRLETARLLRGFEMRKAPPSYMINSYVEAYLFEKFGHGNVTENGKCAWIRHSFTNYDELQSVIRAKPGWGEMHWLVKAYACCAVIRRYELRLTPIYATFGDYKIHILFRDVKDSLRAVEYFVQQRLTVE